MLLVIDVGGTSIKYAGYTKDGVQISHDEMPTPLKDYASFLATIHHIHQSMDDIEGIAISMPGLLDTEKGIAITGGALEFNAGHEIRKDIETICHVPVSIQNDGKCAVLAEMWKGSLKDKENGIVFVIGTGIGGGIMIHRQLYVGSNAFAGEFSFVVQGNHPGIEHWMGSYGSVYALLKAYQKKTNVQHDIDGRYFFKKVLQQEEASIEVLHDYCRNIAVQLYNLQAYFDPDIIAIGGGISAQDILLDVLKEELEIVYQQIPFTIPKANIERCHFGNDANLLGALYQYLLQTKQIKS